MLTHQNACNYFRVQHHFFQCSVDLAIENVSSALGFILKPEQKRTLQNVFVSLPTGFGMCYILLPNLFDVLRGDDTCGNSIILVVSPLIALMKDQAGTIQTLGIRATHVSDKESMTAAVRQGIEKGDYQIVFISPEALFFWN